MDLGIAFIQLLQTQSWALPAMQAAFFMGVEEFFLLILPAVYWCWNPRLGFRLAMVLVVSLNINEILKIAFHTPRPYWISREVKALSTAPSFSMPSGHAQNSMSIWGFLAKSSRRRWAWPGAMFLILIIGISRVYLGVHFLWDVAAGWVIGALILLAFLHWEREVSSWFWGLGPQHKILAALGASGAILALYLLMAAHLGGWSVPWEWAETAKANSGRSIDPLNPMDILEAAGLLLGMTTGYSLIASRGGFNAGGSTAKRIARYLLGSAVLAGIWLGLGGFHLVCDTLTCHILYYMRAFLSGIWVSALAPMFFIKIGLDKKGPWYREAVLDEGKSSPTIPK